MKRLFLLLLAALLVGSASAQVRVDLVLHRANFIRYEPLIATVRITNMTGGELELTDDANRKWFGFQIENAEGTPVPPYNPDYHLSPISIGPGQSIERSVNITPLYPLTEYGIYRIRPVVFVRQFNRFFSAVQPLNVEITEGRLLWQETVGVPGTSDLRTISAMTHRLPNTTQLYLRIEDKDKGLIYCTHQLGRTVSLSEPQIEVSPENTVNVLQNVGPKSYMFTEVGLDGQVLQRKQYQALTEAPKLLRNQQTGELAIVGGSYIDPNSPEQQAANIPPPSVGARPVSAEGETPVKPAEPVKPQ